MNELRYLSHCHEDERAVRQWQLVTEIALDVKFYNPFYTDDPERAEIRLAIAAANASIENSHIVSYPPGTAAKMVALDLRRMELTWGSVHIFSASYTIGTAMELAYAYEYHKEKDKQNIEWPVEVVWLRKEPIHPWALVHTTGVFYNLSQYAEYLAAIR